MVDKDHRLLSIRKHLGLTQKQVADLLGIGQTAYSMIENGRANLTNKNRQILISKLYINPSFLESGEGEYFLSAQEIGSYLSATSVVLPHIQAESRGVPYYSRPVTGSVADEPDDLAGEKPEFHIDFKPFNDCMFYRPVYGESMEPRFHSGDLVACKYVKNKNLILYGEAYLCFISFNGDVYETVKILRKHSDPELVILKPLNPVFDETVVPVSSIRDLYIIKGKIERSL